MGTPQVTTPGASALCAWEVLGCSSGSREVRRGHACLPAFGLSQEMSPAELPDPRNLGWGTGSSPTRLQTAGRTQPARGSGLRGAQVSLMVVTTGCDPGAVMPVFSGAPAGQVWGGGSPRVG